MRKYVVQLSRSFSGPSTTWPRESMNRCPGDINEMRASTSCRLMALRNACATDSGELAVGSMNPPIRHSKQFACVQWNCTRHESVSIYRRSSSNHCTDGPRQLGGRRTGMQNFSDTLSEVFRAIAANKLRSFLTMFGIAWGVGSLLVLIGLGEGFRSGQKRNLAKFGDDVVMMWNGTIPAVANQHTGMRPYQLTLGDAEEMKRLPELRGATVELSRSDLYE